MFSVDGKWGAPQQLPDAAGAGYTLAATVNAGGALSFNFGGRGPLLGGAPAVASSDSYQPLWAWMQGVDATLTPAAPQSPFVGGTRRMSVVCHACARTPERGEGGGWRVSSSNGTRDASCHHAASCWPMALAHADENNGVTSISDAPECFVGMSRPCLRACARCASMSHGIVGCLTCTYVRGSGGSRGPSRCPAQRGIRCARAGAPERSYLVL